MSRHHLTDFPEILWDDEVAVLDQATWDALAVYDGTQPTSPRLGRVWRVQNMVGLCTECDPPEPGVGLILRRLAVIV